jgi:predicted enzyme related to lactoylglutathione lyase
MNDTAEGTKSMSRHVRSGAVIFTGNKRRLATFYAALTGLQVQTDEEDVTVLASDEFELVIHALAGEPQGQTSHPRDDAYIKPFFRVRSLSEARQRAVSLGGRFSPVAEEWEARGFRACEAIDPDGNRVQFREIGTM